MFGRRRRRLEHDLAQARYEAELHGEALGLIRKVLEGTPGDGVPFIDDAVRNVVIMERAYRAGGDRFYEFLEIIDAAEGTPLAEAVRTLREGWQKLEQRDPEAWDDFDACWGALTDEQRRKLMAE